MSEGNFTKNQSSDIRKQLDKFRLHYKNKYNIVLDDELLYFMIRVNELHVDIKKDIKNIPKLQYRNRTDYFIYGLGNFVNGSIIAAILVIIYTLLLKN